MQQIISGMLNDLESTRSLCHQTIMDMIHEYIYREKRYNTHFSVAAIYTDEPIKTHAEKLRLTLRKTDKLLCITDNIVCVVFDAAQENSYVKAAQNLYRTLKEIEYHQQYFIATAISEDFDENYLDMLNRLFERLQYSVEHKLCNSVNYEDYII